MTYHYESTQHVSLAMNDVLAWSYTIDEYMVITYTILGIVNND